MPRARRLVTPRLVLEPLTVEHAAEAARALDDPVLHEFTGGRPRTRAELAERYERLASGRSPDGSQAWLNWVVRHRRSSSAVGTLQATVAEGAADLAWVTATAHQGNGYATEAAEAVVADLRDQGLQRFAAGIHPDHTASAKVARRLGLEPTEAVIDGEVRWEG